MKRELASIAGLALALLSSAPSLAATLINGSFEDGPALNAQHFERDGPAPTGWAVVPGLPYPDIIGALYTQSGAGFLRLLPAQDGSRFLDMNSAAQRGGIYQDVIGLVPGTTAELSYWVGRWAQNSGGILAAELLDPLDLDDALDSRTTTIVKDQTVTSSIWEQLFLTAVVPDSGALRIQFTANSLASATAALGLDNVSLQVTSAVPLPAALPLFATGLGLLGLLSRRRTRKVV